MRKLIREQRKLSCKEKGSNYRKKQRVKVALVHERITNKRNDFLQKQSTMLIHENQTVCIEYLKVKNRMRNHKLAQHLSSASWSKFFDLLKYKAVWYGKDVICQRCIQVVRHVLDADIRTHWLRILPYGNGSVLLVKQSMIETPTQAKIF